MYRIDIRTRLRVMSSLLPSVSPPPMLAFVDILNVDTHHFIYIPALIVYDTVLTAQKEAQVVWKRGDKGKERKNAFIAILYGWIRYGIMAELFLQVLDQFYILRTIPVGA